jgi:Mg-chelatase subunit ChlD
VQFVTARDLLLDRLPSWREHQVNIGLVAYGHNRRGDCQDIEIVVELQPLNEAKLNEAITSISPKGKTPIAGSVSLVTDKLRESESAAHVVLISDGQESCHEDPCTAVSALKELGIEFTLDVIGFDITEAERSQLECIATVGGGRYFSVDSADELHQALQTAEETTPEEKVAQNIQIIMDRSQSMQAPFAGRTKLSVVLQHLEEKLKGPAAAIENLALRSFGGICGDPANTTLDVSFATGNGSVIAERLRHFAFSGDATLSAALKASVQDFSDAARFDEVARRVVLFTGSRGHCDPMEMNAVYDIFRKADIRPEVHLIAIDPPPDHIADLERMSGAAGGYFYPVRTEEELAQVMDRVFDILPVLSGVQTISEILNGVVSYLNDGVQDIEGKNYAAAQTKINEGKKLLLGTRSQFTDLGKRQTRKTFNELYRLARANRLIQEDGFELTEDLLDAHKLQDVTRWNSLIGEWDDSIGTYNANIREIDGILSALK